LKEERRLLAVEKRQAEEKTKAENEKKARMAEVEKKKQEREDAMKARSTFKVKVPSSNAPVSYLSASKKKKKNSSLDPP
jgi:ABC-type sugar transport system ATPase subunit